MIEVSEVRKKERTHARRGRQMDLFGSGTQVVDGRGGHWQDYITVGVNAVQVVYVINAWTRDSEWKKAKVAKLDIWKMAGPSECRRKVMSVVSQTCKVEHNVVDVSQWCLFRECGGCA